MERRGQVTIFIIVAVMMVLGIIIIFMFLQESDVNTPTSLGPQSFIESCAREIVKESLQEILKNGGEITPSKYILYDGDKWNYLCYQADYNLPCYNLHPMLEQQIEKEIFQDTKDKIQNCFDTVREDFESQGYEVGVESDGGDTIYAIDLLPEYVAINLEKKFFVSKDQSSQHFENFDTKLSSSIYDLIEVSRNIVNSEAEFCYFEYSGYMLLYPQYDIRRIDYQDSKIYRVIDRKSKSEFKFATRSCAIAPGV
jgi:hypothetical protein